jgi:uncharacterized protein YeaO (DUF488 family)
MTRFAVELRRVYDGEAADQHAGARILVDRLWPRGISRERANWDTWLKEVAPSDELRSWYKHDPGLFGEFAKRYRTELESDPRAQALAELVALHEKGPLVLLTATKDVSISQAAVLQHLLASG